MTVRPQPALDSSLDFSRWSSGILGDDFCVATRSYLAKTETNLHGNGEPMHAVLTRLTIDPNQAPAAASAFTNDLLPKIRSAPGFVAGYWLEPVDGRGFSFVVFETEEEARRSAPPADNWEGPGININDVDFRRVAASA
jgi:hypothetical protein